MNRPALPAAAAALLLAAGSPVVADPFNPTVAIVAPSTLSGPIKAEFDETVQGVTGDNVVLRVAGTKKDLSASVVCRDIGGERTSCATGAVRTAILRPDDVLAPGQRYVAIVDPAGAAPVTSLVGAEVPRTAKSFRTGLVHQEGSRAAIYRWRRIPSSSASNGSYVSERTAGARAVFRFEGSSVAWITRTGRNQGKARVFIDGERIRTVNNYDPEARFDVRRRFRQLGEDRHRMVIEVLGRASTEATGAWIAVDGFRAGGDTVGQSHAAFRWGVVADQDAFAGGYARSVAKGARSTFRFMGKGIDLDLRAGPNRGIAEVLLDGELRATVDTYASSTGNRRVSLAGLTDAVHRLTVLVTGRKRTASSGRMVAIDRWIVREPPTRSFRGLGTWVDLWDYGLDPAAATADMKTKGVRTLYLQTARYNSGKAFLYRKKMVAWLEEAHARGIDVVGWYLPAYGKYLDADVRRTVKIATFVSSSGERFDALAVDIEFKGKTDSLDEFNDGIRAHLRRVRRRVGNRYPIGGIIPAPVAMDRSPSSWAGFPYGSVGRYTDVVMPMAYWSYRKADGSCDADILYCAYRYTKANVKRSADRTGLRVHVIGGIANEVTKAEVTDFARAARERKAYGASLYDYATTRSGAWDALGNL